jgi:hypothetical protein
MSSLFSNILTNYFFIKDLKKFLRKIVVVAEECNNIPFLNFCFSIGLIINTTYVQVGDGYSGAGAGAGAVIRI